MDTEDSRIFTFSTKLGWFAISHDGGKIRRIKIGFDSELLVIKAMKSVCDDGHLVTRLNDDEREIQQVFKGYAAGGDADFKRLKLDQGKQPEFTRKVIEHCRRVPYGQTLTYGQLAAKAGSPKAARAVGSCMKQNRFPIVIPCHRIVAGGGIGGYNGPNGCQLKRRLLELEGVLAFKA